MLVIDVATRKVIGNVDFGHGVRPHCAVYDPASGLLYVTTELDQSVAAIDPHTLKIIGAIPTKQAESHMLAISHDGKRGYTANVGPGTVSVLDMIARKTIAVIPISANTQRISISNDDRLVFTADQTKPQLAVIDTSTNKVANWIALPASGYGTAATKDGHWLLVALPSANKVGVVDLSTLKLRALSTFAVRRKRYSRDPTAKLLTCPAPAATRLLRLISRNGRSSSSSSPEMERMAWRGRRQNSLIPSKSGCLDSR